MSRQETIVEIPGIGTFIRIEYSEFNRVEYHPLPGVTCQPLGSKASFEAERRRQHALKDIVAFWF